MYMSKAYKILKYIALVVVVYFALRLINSETDNIDTLIIALVVATGFAILENLRGLMMKKKTATCADGSCTGPAAYNSDNQPGAPVEPFGNVLNAASSVVSAASDAISTVSDSTDNSSVSTASTESTESTANTVATQDDAVASVVASSPTAPTSITINSGDGSSTTYTRQSGSDTSYVKSTTASSGSGSSAASPIDTTSTFTTSTASTTSSTASVSITDDYEYDPSIAIAGVEGEIVMDKAPGADFNRLPVSTMEYEYGYSFMPPKDWYPVPPHPPVCVAEKKCPVCPVLTQGTVTGLKEWNSSSKVA